MELWGGRERKRGVRGREEEKDTEEWEGERERKR
jgi:hypothetical protein